MSSDLPAGWTQRTLYELATYQNGRAFKPSETGSEGLPVVKIAELNRGITDATRRYAGELDPKHEINEGDLLFAWSGSVGIYRYAGPRAALNQHIFKVTAESGVDQGFLRWLLLAQMPVFERVVADQATTMGHVKVADLKRLTAPLPPVDEQRRIAWVLGSLDDKIELNRRIAETLEQIAATIFKARFVDFVGVEEFEESELGPIPKGWQIDEIGKVLRVVGGSTPSTKEPAYWNGEYCWATPKDLSALSSPVLLRTSRRVTAEGLGQISSGLLPENTVLLSSRAPIGYTAIARVPTAVNQGFIAIPPSERLPAEFVLFWLRANLGRIKAAASGTTFAEISKRAFRRLAAVIPDQSSVAEFAQLARPVIDKIAALEQEIETLSATREALLPRLISGRLRIPEGFGPDDVAEVADELVESAENHELAAETAASAG